MDMCELAVCCILSCRIFLHLCLCIHVMVEYGKYLTRSSQPLDPARLPSIPLSALYARHPAQEPFPNIVPSAMRYLPVYASGLSEDELSRLEVCEWTKPVSGGGRTAEGGGAVEICEEGGECRESVEEEEEVCSICICGYEVGASVVWLPCGHCYHAQCIRVWLSLRNVCPECRSEVIRTAGQQQLVVAESV